MSTVPYRRTFVRLLGFLRPYKGSLVVSTILAVLSQAAAIAIVLLVGEAIEGIEEQRGTDTLAWIVAAIMVVGVLKAALMVGRRVISGRQALGIEKDMREGLYAHLLRLSFGFYDRHQTGQLMSRATVDLQSVRFFLGFGLIFFFQHFLTIVSVMAVLFVIEWRLALIALAITPAIVAVAYRYSHVSHPVLRDVQQKLGDVATVTEESIVGVHVVKSFAQEERRQAMFERASGAVFDATVRAFRQRAIYVPLLSFLPLLAQAAVLLAAGRMVVSGSLTIDEFFVFNLLLAMLIVPLRSLGMWVGQAQRATASGERIFEVMDEPEGVEDRPGAAELPDGPGAIRFEGLSFAYASDRPVLHEIDLELAPGKTVALIGHTGSGKTTLAALVPRFYDATEGRVLVDGVDVREVTRRSLRREIGVISQDPFLFSATVAREHRLRRPRRDGRADRAGGARGAGARVRGRAAAGLRHGDRRARDHAVGRPAATARDRARARDRPAHPDPGRRDGLGRRDDGGEDPRGPRRSDAGPDDDHHRAPPLDDRARRRGRRARARPDRRAGDAGRGARHERRLPGDPRARPDPGAAEGERVKVWQPGSHLSEERGASGARLVVAADPAPARPARPG